MLEFVTHRSPAKRFLYFRFIVTYINAKRNGNSLFTDCVDSNQPFWASPGPYLRHSTLTTLARNISGCVLPPSLLEGNTFETEEVSAQDGEDLNMVLSAQMRKATITSAARGEKEEDTEDRKSVV